jgi:hypothetical protein
MTEVIDDGSDWKIVINEKANIFAKRVSTERNPNVRVDVALDLKTINGNKSIDVSVANVYYPKAKYTKEDIENKMDEILKKATDPACPLCQRFKAALSVDERATIIDDLMLPKPDLFTPKSISAPVLDAFGDILDSTIKSFELLVPFNPNIESKRKQNSNSK